MKNTKELAVIGVYTALLVGGQFALSFVSGVEVVTVLTLAFAFVFGLKNSLFVANAFCIIRCFIFGFVPSVIVEYLIYYNIFVVCFGLIGKKFNGEYTIKRHILIVALALVFTAGFTMLDNVVTPLFYGFNRQATLSYFYASLITLIPQLICTLVTVAILFYPLQKLLNFIKTKNQT